MTFEEALVEIRRMHQHAIERDQRTPFDTGVRVAYKEILEVLEKVNRG
jgi:hypothetical protein